MNLVDSSFWLEYFAESKYAEFVSDILENMDDVIVPTVVVVEVFKKLLTVTSETLALRFIAQMKKGKIIDLNFEISLRASYYGKEYKLPLADSIIYSSAMHHDSTLYTLDQHFEGLPHVMYFKKA